jgi:hypothetical protein
MLQRALQSAAARYLLHDRTEPAMKHKAICPDPSQAAIAEFLNAHYAHVHVNDVGPVLGRLAALHDEPAADAVHGRQWNVAVSAALTGQGPSHRH